MEKSNLIVDKKYLFNDTCTGLEELVTYNRETINHFVFSSETQENWICFTTLKNNISEIPNGYDAKTARNKAAEKAAI